MVGPQPLAPWTRAWSPVAWVVAGPPLASVPSNKQLCCRWDFVPVRSGDGDYERGFGQEQESGIDCSRDCRSDGPWSRSHCWARKSPADLCVGSIVQTSPTRAGNSCCNWDHGCIGGHFPDERGRRKGWGTMKGGTEDERALG